MWYIYSFKLAYAEDNSFELRVNTTWTCSEFIEKVTAVARIIFPSISVIDVMHVTESWNHINNPNYNTKLKNITNTEKKGEKQKKKFNSK
jgi:hypothetical protein